MAKSVVQNSISVSAGWNKVGRMEKIRVNLRKDVWLYLMLIPFVAFYIIFLYKPMLGLVIAFQDYSLFKGISGSPWVGWENFRMFFEGPYFLRNLKNTFLINFYSLIWSFPLPIILALLFNEVKHVKYRQTVQTLSYLPHFVSTVVIVGIVTNFLSPSSGIINLLIEKLGGERTYFLTKPEYFRTIYVAMQLWKETGFASIIYFAALSGIDMQLYEAAVIDGAGKWKQMLHVTLPGLAPTIIIMLIMRLGNLLKAGYETIILLYQPATYETADVISSYVYRAGLLEGNYQLATAAGVFDSVVALILTCMANYLSKKVTETSLW